MAKKVVSVLKPILVAFISSEAVRRLVVEILRELSKLSDNNLDDAAVDFIETQLVK